MGQGDQRGEGTVLHLDLAGQRVFPECATGTATRPAAHQGEYDTL